MMTDDTDRDVFAAVMADIAHRLRGHGLEVSAATHGEGTTLTIRHGRAEVMAELQRATAVRQAATEKLDRVVRDARRSADRWRAANLSSEKTVADLLERDRSIWRDARALADEVLALPAVVYRHSVLNRVFYEPAVTSTWMSHAEYAATTVAGILLDMGLSYLPMRPVRVGVPDGDEPWMRPHERAWSVLEGVQRPLPPSAEVEKNRGWPARMTLGHVMRRGNRTATPIVGHAHWYADLSTGHEHLVYLAENAP